MSMTPWFAVGALVLSSILPAQRPGWSPSGGASGGAHRATPHVSRPSPNRHTTRVVPARPAAHPATAAGTCTDARRALPRNGHAIPRYGHPITAAEERRSGGSGAHAVPDPVSLTLESLAVDPETKAQALADAKAFFRLRVEGSAVSAAVRKLIALRWHKSLASARREARRDNKLILWVQALGEFGGFT